MSLPTPTVQRSTPKQHVSLRRRSQSSLGAGCTPNKARCVTPSTKSLVRHAGLKGVTLGILTPSIIWMYHAQHSGVVTQVHGGYILESFEDIFGLIKFEFIIFV